MVDNVLQGKKMDLCCILCYKMIKAVEVKNIKNSLPFPVIITQLLKKN